MSTPAEGTPRTSAPLACLVVEESATNIAAAGTAAQGERAWALVGGRVLLERSPGETAEQLALCGAA